MKRRPKTPTRIAATVLTVAVALSLVACEKVGVTRFYQRGVVASVSPIAADVGRDVIEQGGNAFDAAVAVAFTLAVTYPQGNIAAAVSPSCVRERDVVALISVKPPRRRPSTMYLDSLGEVIPDLRTGLAGAFPARSQDFTPLGEVWELRWSIWSHRRPGSPTGFVVDKYLAEDLQLKDARRFRRNRSIFLPNGETLREGERLVQSVWPAACTRSPRKAHRFYASMIATASWPACRSTAG
jgi:hypothetical protein